MRFLSRSLGLAALASLVSSAACPRLAAACDVALPDIREYSGLENQTAVDLDLVAVQSGAGYFYGALPKLGAHLETLGGALVPTSRNDVDAGVSL